MKSAANGIVVVNVNEVAGNIEMETVMAERKGMGLVAKRQGVVCINAAASGEGAMREGTTGRVIAMTLPKVWAVAEGGKAVPAIQAAPAQKKVRETSVEVRFYRKYTEGLLRRYTQMSLEAGGARGTGRRGEQLPDSRLRRCGELSAGCGEVSAAAGAGAT